MKRTTTFLAAGLVGASGFASVAYAQDATLYGRITTGIYYSKSDNDDAKATWDLGSVDAGDLKSEDKLWSRIGVRASYDLGNGMTSGLHLEKRLDNFRTRHQNAWLQGPFGRLTLGQQGSPYYGAVTWDGANLFGGQYDPGSRKTGVTFATMMDGPFNASVMIQDNDDNDEDGKKDAVGQGEGLDSYEIAADFSFSDAFSLSAGYLNPDGDDNDGMGFSVQGSVAGFSWDVGYTRTDVAAKKAKSSVATQTIAGGRQYPDGKDAEFKEGSPSAAAVDAGTTTAYGVHVGYAGAYGQYGRSKKNNDNVQDEDSVDYWIVGYSHLLGPNTRLIAEYKNEDEDANTAALALRVDF